MVAIGDLIVDRHPDVPNRSFEEKLLGCVKSEAIPYQTKLHGLLSEFHLKPNVDLTDLNNVHSTARAAALAYEDDAHIAVTAQSWGFSRENVRIIRSGSQVAVLMAAQDVLLVSFRGTKTWDDVRVDVKVWPVSSPSGGKVHKGFHDALDGLWPSLVAALKELGNPRQPIVLTGHSLGGALATLAAARLTYGTLKVEIAALYTFGQPQVGNRDFVNEIEKDFGSKYARFVVDVDAVVKANLIMQHAGRLFYFDSQGRLHDGEPPFPQLHIDAACAPVYKSGAEFKSHKISSYIDRLERTLTINSSGTRQSAPLN